jgi:hypothetical protein
MENLRTAWIEVIRGIIGRASQYWGAPQHLHIRFNKVTVFGFPFAGGTMLVISEPNVPLTVISDIQNVLKESYE